MFDNVVGVSLNTPATPALPAADRLRLPARQPRSSRARPICCPARRATTGSTASLPATSCASRSPSAPCPTSAAARARKLSAARNPARHSATQRAAVSALRSVGSSGGSHSVRSITRTRGSAASQRTAQKKSVAAIPPGRAPGAPGNCERSITSMSQSTTIASQCATWSSARLDRALDPVAAHVADRDDQIAGRRPRRGASPRCWRRSRARPGRCSRPAARPRSAPAPDCRC